MTDHHASGRFDVHATGELSSSLDSAEERARLLQALNADRDLCSALLCGERQLLCSGVEWAQAQAFAALMNDCGVETQVMPHRDGAERAAMAALDEPLLTAEAEPAVELIEEGAGRGAEVVRFARARSSVIYEADDVEVLQRVPEPPPRRGSIDTVLAEGGADIPVYLLEADARERGERRRQRRRWGLASLLVLAAALMALLTGGDETFSSQQAYVHVLASAVNAGADGVVAELLVQPGQSLKSDEAVAVIAPTKRGAQRLIEVTPVAGVVDQIGVSSGQRVKRGEPLLTLAQPGSAYLLAYFEPKQLRELSPQSIVQIHLDDFPGQPILGRLHGDPSVPAQRTGDAGRSAVRIDFEDGLPLLQQLRSGMAASVTIRRQPAAK